MHLKYTIGPIMLFVAGSMHFALSIALWNQPVVAPALLTVAWGCWISGLLFLRKHQWEVLNRKLQYFFFGASSRHDYQVEPWVLSALLGTIEQKQIAFGALQKYLSELRQMDLPETDLHLDLYEDWGKAHALSQNPWKIFRM